MKFLKDDDGKENAAIGCVILFFGGCACIGGLLFFIRFILDILKIL